MNKRLNKRLFAAILICVVLLFLVGCGSEPIQINVSNNDELHSNQFGKFIKINNYFIDDTVFVF